MNILVLGSGGREHSICYELSKSKNIKKVYCAPGNAGIAAISDIAMIDYTNFKSISNFCKKNKVDTVIPGSEEYLEKGISDYLIMEGISVIGPSKSASLLETSKYFTKKICDISGIKTAKWTVCDNVKQAKKLLKNKKFPLVLKMDSLAAGKGVIVAKKNTEAEIFLNNVEKGNLGNKNSKILIEECLLGEEGSFFFAVDGNNVKFLGSAKDYKRVADGNKGLNTGGMGCISPSPRETKKVISNIIVNIIKPTLKTMQTLGYPYTGFLYAGVMFTKKGIYLIEYNVRLGDPECQAILGRIESNFLDICVALKRKNLKNLKVKLGAYKTSCVVLASKGYPGKYKKGKKISGIEDYNDTKNVRVYHAGTAKDNKGNFITSGGRVLNIVCKAKSLKKALSLTYDICRKVSWKDYFYRKDIGS
ncbi:phosphoribosylamine--glycine ligase [Alphaproteobacteria bacterium]|nr:phosphoribosylamine--glycine ligase [Alphaproteobacteria bacterium]